MSISDRAFALEGRWLMGKLIPHRLLEGIGTHLGALAPGREDEIVEAIATRAKELIAGDEEMVVDGASKGMLAMSAVVLAGYEILRPELDDDGPRTILFLQHIFNESMSRSVEVIVGALASRKNPLDKVEKAMQRSSAMYGSYFHFEFERPDEATFEMRVERCFFRDFFARHDALIVTTVLCSLDAAWMQALDPAVSGLRAERTSLLSLGADACRFRVIGTDDPLAPYSDAIDQRFVDA